MRCTGCNNKGCDRFYFKYCSTFDSTIEGNIGPVTDALMDALGVATTVISPALPINGRTVYQGHLFVEDRLLQESGMRNHPVNPMDDSDLRRLMERQSRGHAPLSMLRCWSPARRPCATASKPYPPRAIAISHWTH